jgi:hypothetical protein
MDLEEEGREGMAWVDLAQNRDRLCAVVNVVMNLQVPQNAGHFVTEDLIAPQEGLCSM